MATCTIWAETLDVPHNVNEDARLRDRDTPGIFNFDSDDLASAAQKWTYPNGPYYGQAGWDWGRLTEGWMFDAHSRAPRPW